jgi:hypothetical protein
MPYINETVSDWKITVTELVKPDPGEPVRVFQTVTIKTIAQLREYFLTDSKFSVARSLQYKATQPPPEKFNDRLFGRLSFTYTDRMSTKTFEFATAADFAKFIKDHPALAKCVEFTF